MVVAVVVVVVVVVIVVTVGVTKRDGRDSGGNVA